MKVPSMGDSISEGTVVNIVKTVGEHVNMDEVVIVLETDKVRLLLIHINIFMEIYCVDGKLIKSSVG